jgi:uncharacterized Zn finger protein
MSTDRWPPRSPGHGLARPTGAGARRAFGRSWWGAAWIEALEGRARLDPNRLPRGRSYARSGAVGELEVTAGEVRAPVQGSRRQPYDVRVRVHTFNDAEWQRILDAIAGQVGHTAALLDGELPPEVLDDVRRAGLDLLPGPGDLQPRCSCPDWADPCKHAAAVCYLVAETLDRDPFALLALRGRNREEVLAGLRSRRTRGVEPVASEGTPPDPGVSPRDAWRAERPPLPAAPLPPARAGQPAPLALDPPPGSGVDSATLLALAADTARRAYDLALGRGDGGLGLDRVADLARRAEALIGTKGFDALARRAGARPRMLVRDALAYRYGATVGFELLHRSWNPDPDDLVEGRGALGEAARVRANRVTAGDRQLRLAPDGTWYPYRRSGVHWDPAGPGHPDPVVAISSHRT